MKSFDYKDSESLKKYLDTHARLLPRKKTGLTAKRQRQLAQEVKRARFLGLLPYISR
ncbi:MAG: 30S ribosomal protein S18 [Candidatus Lloydbacteria bacterium CG22_combo_CG10-13_8_21_14_all_47_15]|uniref:30S ribosomal protein S18 n=1 Tax=Candidatus Lloydbacteria bacterium CG22_combo_CG10-13_8_21_14_all_47_15 TaxID=1974635 RepID=A0A2H0CT90_9BACT|nr:MAG: 30S ribosomal protein S18 [Candidatus Lloydbacteria bacterium CG22_combo_CG10-13_8_21_14_all_47_15]